MAILNKITADRRLSYSGTFGNVSVGEEMQYTAAAAQIGDTIYLGVIPQGSTVFNLRSYNAALGASVTVSLGYTPVDPGSTLTPSATYFLGATAMSSAGWQQSVAAPIKFNEPVYLTATIGGAAATGNLQAYPLYDYRNV